MGFYQQERLENLVTIVLTDNFRLNTRYQDRNFIENIQLSRKMLIARA